MQGQNEINKTKQAKTQQQQRKELKQSLGKEKFELCMY